MSLSGLQVPGLRVAAHDPDACEAISSRPQEACSTATPSSWWLRNGCPESLPRNATLSSIGVVPDADGVAEVTLVIGHPEGRIIEFDPCERIGRWVSPWWDQDSEDDFEDDDHEDDDRAEEQEWMCCSFQWQPDGSVIGRGDCGHCCACVAAADATMTEHCRVSQGVARKGSKAARFGDLSRSPKKGWRRDASQALSKHANPRRAPYARNARGRHADRAAARNRKRQQVASNTEAAHVSASRHQGAR